MLVSPEAQKLFPKWEPRGAGFPCSDTKALMPVGRFSPRLSITRRRYLRVRTPAGWENALALLDDKFRYWPRLSPIVVHRDFRDAILAAVVARVGNEEADRWLERIETVDRMAHRRARRLRLS
jgi:hypothetical protein